MMLAPCGWLQVNASWMGEFIRQYNNVDINVAVASPAGLMVPFVRDADRKGLLAISEEVKSLAAKVRCVLYCISEIALCLFPLRGPSFLAGLRVINVSSSELAETG
jgi:hypothetical protein